MDISLLLGEIIKKYSLGMYYPEYDNMLRAIDLIGGFSEQLEGKTLLVATLPQDIDIFLSFLGKDIDYSSIVANYVLSKGADFKNSFCTKKILDANPYEYDKVVLVSFFGEAKIKWFFRQNNIDYISIYDYFQANELRMEREFYHFFEDRSQGAYRDNHPEDINHLSRIPFERVYLKQEINNCCDHKYKEICIKKAFFLAVYEKDFIDARSIISEYKDLFGLDMQIKAMQEIEDLLIRIKHAVVSRKSKAIVTFWLDQVSYDDVKDFRYINERKEKGIWFNNIFTITPHTTGTFRSIFLEGGPVDDNTYDVKKIDDTNSRLVQSLTERGFKIVSIGNSFKNLDKRYRVDSYIFYMSSFTERIWEVLRYLCLNDEKIFLLAHELMETHATYLNADMNDFSIVDARLRQLSSMEFVSKQLYSFDEFKSDNMVTVCMSDHGDSNFLHRFQTLLLIQGNGIPGRTVNSLVSLKSFRKIIEQLIDCNDINEDDIKEDKIEIQDTNYYSGRGIGRSVKNGIVYLFMLGFRGIVDEDNIFVRFSNGRMWLANRRDLENQLPPLIYCDVVYDEEVAREYCEKISGKIIPSIYENNKGYARYLELAVKGDRTKQYNEKKFEIVMSIIDKLGPEGIAIRTGGEHSRELIGLLKARNKKVSYIIDKNKKCLCCDMGIPVVSPEDIDGLRITEILWVYMNLRKDLEREKQDLVRRGIRVIDIYEILENNGVELDHRFYTWDLIFSDSEIKFPYDEVGL